jgi:NADH pyrophosphatase NudC (nudix superfamily)
MKIQLGDMPKIALDFQYIARQPLEENSQMAAQVLKLIMVYIYIKHCSKTGKKSKQLEKNKIFEFQCHFFGLKQTLSHFPSCF